MDTATELNMTPSQVRQSIRDGVAVHVRHYQHTAAMRLAIRTLTCSGQAIQANPWQGDWPTLVPGRVTPGTADTGVSMWEDGSQQDEEV